MRLVVVIGDALASRKASEIIEATIKRSHARARVIQRGRVGLAKDTFSVAKKYVSGVPATAAALQDYPLPQKCFDHMRSRRHCDKYHAPEVPMLEGTVLATAPAAVLVMALHMQFACTTPSTTTIAPPVKYSTSS